MAQYRDIDLPIGVPLRVNGDLLIPSSFKLLGDIISGNSIIENNMTLSSKYLAITAKAADSELLDGINSTQFLRNDQAGTISGKLTISTGGLLVSSGGIDTSTTIGFGTTTGRGNLSSTSGLIVFEASSVNSSINIKSTGTGNVRINGNIAYHEGNFNSSGFVRSDTTGQQVTGDFSIVDNSTLYIGTGANKSGVVMIKGAGANMIQIDGANGTKLSGIKIYMNASGNADFSGTVTANKIVVADTEMVPNLNAETLAGKKELDFAKTVSILESSGYGVYSGLVVSAQTPTPNMSVRVSTGIVYTDTGRRYSIIQTDQSIIAASTTYPRQDIVFIYGSLNAAGSPSGALEGTVGYKDGTPAAAPVDPIIPTGAIKLARIILGASQGTVQTANIVSLIELKHFTYDNTGFHIRRQPLSIESNITSDSTTVVITKPIKGTSWAKSHTISAGSRSITWTHNLGLGASYVLSLSCNSPNRHVYWESKTTNSVIIWIDDITDVAVVIDAVITAI